MRGLFILFGLWLGLLGAPLQAQPEAEKSEASSYETRVGAKGFEAAKATIEQFDWLVGQWVGAGIKGAPATESWLPPTGGTMVGTFVQETASDDGEAAIMFSEHMYLVKDGASVSLKLKHFNADLTGWEEKDDMLTFRLLAIEDCAAYFSGLTLRCAGKDRLVAAVRMQSDKPQPQELVFYFTRLGSGGIRPCPDAETTLDMNECYAAKLAAAKERHEIYLEAARKRNDDSPELVAKIDAAEKIFRDYREAECGAVYEAWKSGSIRNMMSLACAIDLTNQRTHTVWSTWLTYMDSAPPILPRPKPNF